MTNVLKGGLAYCLDHGHYLPCRPCQAQEKLAEDDPARETSDPNGQLSASKLPNGKTVDDVRQPAHYTVGGIETIDYMAAKSSVEEFRGHLRLTAMKYLSRAGHKDDALKDYKKAAVYLGWLIKHMETGSIK